MKNSVARRNNTRIVALIAFACMLVCEVFGPKIFSGVSGGDWIYGMLSRFFGGVACLALISTFLSVNFLKFKASLKKTLIFLPCMLIAVNNFPFASMISGDAYINWDIKRILLYACLCISVGLYEEMAFRGCIFSFVLQRRGRRVIDVFWSIVISSAIFGVVHVVNMFLGADPGATLLQIGYSFLIGGMCSVILVKTHNIWFCVILHAVYNFAGGVVPNCGGGIIWTVSEVVLTAVVAILVAVYVIYTLCKIQPEDIEGVFKKNEAQE